MRGPKKRKNNTNYGSIDKNRSRGSSVSFCLVKGLVPSKARTYFELIPMTHNSNSSFRPEGINFPGLCPATHHITGIRPESEFVFHPRFLLNIFPNFRRMVNVGPAGAQITMSKWRAGVNDTDRVYNMLRCLSKGVQQSGRNDQLSIPQSNLVESQTLQETALQLSDHRRHPLPSSPGWDRCFPTQMTDALPVPEWECRRYPEVSWMRQG